MAHWTTEQVEKWLTKHGFEQFVEIFRDNQIDGQSLLALTDDVITEILFIHNKNQKQNNADIQRFKDKLQEWRMKHKEDRNRQNKERPSSVASSATTMLTASSTDDTNYTKTLTISSGNSRIDVKFFKNPLFCTKLQHYLFRVHNIKCSIECEGYDIVLTMVGVKQQVKAGRDDLKNIFVSTRTKIYNSEVTDRKIISWSQNILSDMTVNVIQQIMDNERILTIWDKTEMFSGYYKVTYFTCEPFAISENDITQILNREIVYVDNIKMPNEKTKHFMNEIEQFVKTNKQPELAIIHCKYPFQMEIKISLFGRKKHVKTVKKSLQLLINKHTLKAFDIKMTPAQHNFLIDNCLRKIKDIEQDYKDDNVQIRIRLKEFYAPQYLIDRIKQDIYELICQTTICVIQKIGDSIPSIDEQITKLNEIARQYYCNIEKVESKIEIQVHAVPKALEKTVISSKQMIEQSNLFCSTKYIRKISVLNGSIELHTDDHCRSSSDITVISTETGATEEHIGFMPENGYFETTLERRIVVRRWLSPISDEDNANVKIKRSVEKFISSVAQCIATNCSNTETIVFLASEWENFNVDSQLAEQLIMEMKREIEIRRSHWRVLFIFNNEQSRLYKGFLQTMIRLQTDDDNFAHFLTSVLTIHVTLVTAKGNNLMICENEINQYIEKNLATTEILKNTSDLKKWDQHMINTFYKYCLEKFVLPKVDLTTSQLQLIGPVEEVEKTKQKYKIMCEILKYKSLIRNPPPVIPRSSIMRTNQLNSIDNNSYNIAFSYCPQDQMICHQLATALIKEGYSLCQPSSGRSLSKVEIERSDLMLIYFSENFTQDICCLTDIKYAKSIGKKLIPIAGTTNILPNADECCWLSAMINTQLSYNLLDAEIEMEFADDFDLEYDKLLAILLRHTRPGVTGQVYKQLPIASEVSHLDGNEEQGFFGCPSVNLQKVTKEQRKEREKAYKLQLNKQIEKEKIPSDELKKLVVQLKPVINDLEAILKGQNPDHFLSSDEQAKYRVSWTNSYGYSQTYAKDLLGSIKRWLKQTPNVIKKNIAPFTLTGDINDALFPIYQPTNHQWWRADYEGFDHSPRGDYFSTIHSNINYSFTNENTHDYFQLLIKTGKTNFNTTIEAEDAVWETVSIHEVDDHDEDEIDDQWKTPEEIQKLQELDSLNRKWKRKNNLMFDAFMTQKRRNIVEFQQLCNSDSN